VTFANGILSGTPTEPGTFSVTITATNGVSPAAAQSFTLMVDGPTVATSTGSSKTPVAVCVVPNLRHMTVGQARQALRSARCELGHVNKPKRLRRHHVLRVITQSARANSSHPHGYTVNIATR
jgi:hypothetical protein